jgi:hypothetical protein
LSVNKSASGYRFDKVAKALYAEVTMSLAQERTNHIMRPFGCDMAYVDASVNYIITDELINVWKELGFDQDIKIEYSTPTRFYEEVKKENENNSTNLFEQGGWPLRKDDTFPFSASTKNGQSYFSGYYSSRPLLKKAVRKLGTTFHSMSRLIAQQALRTDVNTTEAQDKQFESLNF